MDNTNDMEIKQADEIVAIQILADTYHINVFDYSREELGEIIRLLGLVKESKTFERKK
jgi:hypothetical protein